MDIGRLIGDLATGGGTYFKRQKKARRKKREANEIIAQNTQLAQDLYDRDLGQSQWANVQSDPAMRAAQQDALTRMEGLSRTGFDANDRAALDQAFMQSRQEEQGQRQAALSAAARRGDASGGNSLMASLGAQQGGANRASQYATDVGLAGRDRALQALEQYGNMAGQQRAQDFGEQAQRAGGLDSFTQWATGQKSSDAQFLNNARLGQASNLQAQAAQMQATPVLDATVQGLATYYTGGLAGNVTGGGSSGGGYQAGDSGGSGLYGGSASGTAANAQWGSGNIKSMGQVDKSGVAPAAPAPAPAQNYAARRRRASGPTSLSQQTANYFGGGR